MARLGTELLHAALDWYKSHLGYLFALEAGVKRVGIKGEAAGTVTETEARQAKALALEEKARDKARREAQQAPIVEVVKRADAIKEPTPMTKTVKPPDSSPPTDPLAGVQALTRRGARRGDGLASGIARAPDESRPGRGRRRDREGDLRHGSGGRVMSTPEEREIARLRAQAARESDGRRARSRGSKPRSRN